MQVWTLTTDTDEINTQAFATEAECYTSLRTNFDPEGEFANLSNGDLIDELTERQSVVLYIEKHEI